MLTFHATPCLTIFSYFRRTLNAKSTVMQNQEDKTNLPEKISPMSSDTETEEQKEEKLAVEVSPKLYS